jgi:glycosyltransferase involved in cell wall biosynthesis
MQRAGISVVIPAANEAAALPGCLAALLASDDPGRPVEAVVAANGCRDATAEIARARAGAFAARGWRLGVVELAQGSKPAALDAGDAAAGQPLRAYLDADVTLSPPLLAALAAALDGPGARYASGRPRLTARGPAARLYARAWARVPFMAEGVPGCGLFAVNAEGRARWGAWPPLIADDLFARLMFEPAERRLVPHPYDWPLAEGLAALIRVRERQDRGVRELRRLFPELARRDGPRPGAGRAVALLAADPPAALVYLGVALATRLRPPGRGWSRGR